jgi:hypothetical protein
MQRLEPIRLIPRETLHLHPLSGRERARGIVRLDFALALPEVQHAFQVPHAPSPQRLI